MLEDGMVDLEAMIDSMIAQLQGLIDPVFNTATSLSLPLPPVVAPIKALSVKAVRKLHVVVE